MSSKKYIPTLGLTLCVKLIAYPKVKVGKDHERERTDGGTDRPISSIV
jgi:hypothetical protein